MHIEFSDQVVLVTGATRGIGKQIADDFAELGASLIVTGTKEEDSVRQDDSPAMEGRKGRRYYRVDFAHPRSIESFIHELEQLDRLDVCVNNAGRNKIDYIENTQISDWDNIFAVNLKAPFLIIREISKIMRRHRYGRIVNIGSIYGSISKEKRSIYSATKFGIRGLTVAASNELAKYNILVNTVSPGFVLTDLTRKILSEKEILDLAGQIPMQRLAGPRDISPVVLFLASRMNTYITGQNLIVDGGYVNV